MAAQSKKSRSRAVATVAQTPVVPQNFTYKSKVYTKNNQSHVISSETLTSLVNEITMNPQQSARFYARKTGLTVESVNLLVEKHQTVRRLARTGMIAVMDRGRRPGWYHDMAPAQQALVPMVYAEDQYEAIAATIFPTKVNVDDDVVREDSELMTMLFGAVLARTNLSNTSALALANEMMEIVQHNAETLATAKRDIKALAQDFQLVNLRLTNSAALRIAAE